MQYGLCVVQVDNWFERYAKHRCANIGPAKGRVVSHEMATATRAELSVTWHAKSETPSRTRGQREAV
jgi:hypothetical protein